MRNLKARLNRNRVRMPSFLISMLARRRARMPGGLLDDATALVSLAEVLDAIPDPRRCRGRRYRLGPLLVLCLVLCLVAVLAGAADWAGITRFAAGLDPATRARIGLARGIPRATTVARLLRPRRRRPGRLVPTPARRLAHRPQAGARPGQAGGGRGGR
jgi:hypothetical protein